MNRLIPLTDIDDFRPIVEDLNPLLKMPENLDIAEGFPATFRRYGLDPDDAIKNFNDARALYQQGKREQFIVSSGTAAVGSCIITNLEAIIKSPAGINQEWPNISGYIARPYRGQGLGRFSIEERMKVVKANFGDHAWTYVSDDNHISEHLVTSVGFERIGDGVGDWQGHGVFIYEGSDAQP